MGKVDLKTKPHFMWCDGVWQVIALDEVTHTHYVYVADSIQGAWASYICKHEPKITFAGRTNKRKQINE